MLNKINCYVFFACLVLLSACGLRAKPTNTLFSSSCASLQCAEGSVCQDGVCVLVASTCGNGVVEPGEACDDGDDGAKDGCNGVCRLELGWYCDGSPSLCSTRCGDGVRAGKETCDDGNMSDSDACPSSTPFLCRVARCGDGYVQSEGDAESCDDGNEDDNDGCSASCAIETGWSCSAEPSRCTCAPGFADRDNDGVCDRTCALSSWGCNSSNGSARGVCRDVGQPAICACDAGYQDNDDNGSCNATCATAALPCAYGACSDAEGTAACECSPGYTGPFCNTCADGFQDNDGNTTCLPSCDGVSCPGNKQCTDAVGAASCDCPSGLNDADDNDVCTISCALAVPLGNRAALACSVSPGVLDPFSACDDSSGSAACHCVVYVDKNSPAATPTGASWAMAFKTVEQGMLAAQDKLSLATPSCDVWVADGTYNIFNERGYTVDNEGEGLTLLSDVRAYGGFKGASAGGYEFQRTQRNWTANPTILDGRSASNAANKVNHVVVSKSRTVLDGFTVQFGGEHPSIDSGGLLNKNVDDVKIANCIFKENIAPNTKSGGGINNTNATNVRITGSLFHSNWAGHGGAIAASTGSSVLIEDSFLVGNVSNNTGGAFIGNGNSVTIVRDTLISGNRSYRGAILVDNTAQLNLENTRHLGNWSLTGDGAALTLSGAGTVNMTRAAFVGNFAGTQVVAPATAHGGAIALVKTFASQTPTLVASFSTLVANNVFGDGGAISLGFTNTPWAPTTAYAANAVRWNTGNRLYVATSACTSGNTGGPIGTGTNIADGSCVWSYSAPGADGTVSATITSSIVWGNTNNELRLGVQTPSLSVGTNVIEGGAPLCESCVDSGGNTSSNPVFALAATGTWQSVSYDASTEQTTLTASGSPGWAANAFASIFLQPDTSNSAFQYEIISNTAQSITVWGEASLVAASGDNFAVRSYIPTAPEALTKGIWAP